MRCRRGKIESVALEIMMHIVAGAHVHTDENFIKVYTDNDRILWYVFSSSDNASETYFYAKEIAAKKLS